jgi:anti-sigma factor ChrR (cupin superfamily)
MTEHVVERLTDLVVGFLTQSEVAEVEAHLAGCEACSSERAAFEGVVHSLSLSLEPVDPPPALRQSILDAVASGPDRFAPMFDRLSALFDIAVDTARDYLARLTDPEGWVELMPGLTYLDLEGGPAAPGTVGLVCLDEGVRFPVHKHVGVEHVLVLKGGIRDMSGDEIWAGDMAEMPDGSEHWFEALGPEGLIYAVVVGDVEILGPAPEK